MRLHGRHYAPSALRGSMPMPRPYPAKRVLGTGYTMPPRGVRFRPPGVIGPPPYGRGMAASAVCSSPCSSTWCVLGSSVWLISIWFGCILAHMYIIAIYTPLSVLLQRFAEFTFGLQSHSMKLLYINLKVFSSLPIFRPHKPH